MSIIGAVFSDYTIRNVVLGTAIIGIVSGSLGAFAVLRKQSLLGDAISHAALPGIALAFLLTRSKAPIVILIGAAVVGWLGTLAIMHIVRNSRIKEDAAMGIVLSVFFGIGMVILTFIQKMPIAAQAGLDTFLFGQAATMMAKDVVTMSILGGIAIVLMIVFWKEFKVLTFNRDFGETQGLSMKLVDIILTTAVVIAIVLGLQAVGVVLMSAMIVSPGVAARQWTNKLSGMVVLSGLFGAISGVSGALISASMANMPTGPTIVVSLTAILVFSVLFAGNRGIVWAALRTARNRRRFALDGIVQDLHVLAETHHQDVVDHGHSVRTLELMRHRTEGVDKALRALSDRGLVYQHRDETWSLTERGHARAEQLGRDAT